MSEYHVHEMTFELPNELVDQTVNVFSTKKEGPSEFSLVVTRDELGQGEGLEEYVTRQYKQMEKQFPGFEHLGRAAIQAGGMPALQTEYRWVANGKKMYHRQVVTVAGGHGVGRRRVMMVTATAEKQLSPEWEASFQRIIASLRPRAV